MANNRLSEGHHKHPKKNPLIRASSKVFAQQYALWQVGENVIDPTPSPDRHRPTICCMHPLPTACHGLCMYFVENNPLTMLRYNYALPSWTLKHFPVAWRCDTKVRILICHQRCNNFVERFHRKGGVGQEHKFCQQLMSLTLMPLVTVGPSGKRDLYNMSTILWEPPQHPNTAI